MRWLVAWLLLAAALAGCGDTAPTLPSGVGVAGDGTLDSVLEFIRDDNDLPSLAAVLVHGGQVVESAAVGVRAAECSEEVTSDDRWHLGSLTKAMTATLAAILVEQGTVSWSTTVGDVFPDLVGSIRPEYEDVTPEELLYHTTGLPEDITAAPSWPTLRADPAPLLAVRRRFAAELL